MTVDIPYKILSTFSNIILGMTFLELEWVVFALFTIMTVVVSVVMIYHWRKYGLGERKFLLLSVVFLIVSAVLLLLASQSIS